MRKWTTIKPERLQRLYALMLVPAREAAWNLGWALATHGTARRDFDLFGIPWIDNAAPAEMLVRGVAEAVVRKGVQAYPACNADGSMHWNDKPHGRRAAVIHVIFRGSFGTHAYIDLSVMPRLPWPG